MVLDCLVPARRFQWLFEELVYMRKCIFVFLAVFCVLGCSSPIVANEDEVGELLKKGAVLVDVRTQDEFDSGHLEKAVHLPHQRIEELPKLVDVEKDTPIVVYCRSGNRSSKAKATLDGLGYTKVINGGAYSDLKAAGLK